MSKGHKPERNIIVEKLRKEVGEGEKSQGEQWVIQRWIAKIILVSWNRLTFDLLCIDSYNLKIAFQRDILQSIEII